MQSEDFLSAIETLAVSVDAFHRRFDIPQIDMASVDGTLDALRQTAVPARRRGGGTCPGAQSRGNRGGREGGSRRCVYRIGYDSPAGNGRPRRLP